jgi:hypothetical protein
VGDDDEGVYQIGAEAIGMGRFFFNLFSQMRDVDAQVMRLLHRLRPPDFRQQLAVRQNLAGVRHKQSQQRIFNQCELDFLAAPARTNPAIAATAPARKSKRLCQFHQQFPRRENLNSKRLLQCQQIIIT